MKFHRGAADFTVFLLLEEPEKFRTPAIHPFLCGSDFCSVAVPQRIRKKIRFYEVLLCFISSIRFLNHCSFSML